MSHPPLPLKFSERVILRHPAEADAFLASLDEERTYGLRINTLKLPMEHVRHILPFTLQGVPWCDTGFYYSAHERPGLHPLHGAGLYYIQEPTAMFVVECLDVRPGQVVLDLCASPGGKATQILDGLKGEGLLVANEITSSRIKPLVFNLERYGAVNFVVTSAPAEHLAQQLPCHFDRILIDAPCSGEGLFRKDPGTRLAWEPGQPAGCAKRQRELLDWGAQMLKPGGLLVYSTCTFAEEENEWLIADFLHSTPEFTAETPAVRLLPHKIRGEGHFCAVLRKKGKTENHVAGRWHPVSPPPAVHTPWQIFSRDYCPTLALTTGRLHHWDDDLYLVPSSIPELKGIRIRRVGLKLGRVSGKHFLPDHALALSTEKTQLPKINFPPDHKDLHRYLRGEAIPWDNSIKGWALVCCEGFPLGLGKVSEGQLKNHLPKGLRAKNKGC